MAEITTIPAPDDLPFPPAARAIRCRTLGHCRAAASTATIPLGPAEAAGIRLGRAGSSQAPRAVVVAATGRWGREEVVGGWATNHTAAARGHYKAAAEEVVVVVGELD